jgi:DNA invertase Pin-like site-specific DNA recombinase
VDEVLSSIRWAKENHLNIYLQKEGLHIYDRDGKENPYLTIMIAVLGTAAQLERENIAFRLQSGRRRYVERNLALTGKSGLGREGYRKPKEQKAEEYKETLKLLRKGYPYRKVAKLTGVSTSTVKRLKKEFEI